jgi:hypothetical protein
MNTKVTDKDLKKRKLHDTFTFWDKAYYGALIVVGICAILIVNVLKEGKMSKGNPVCRDCQNIELTMGEVGNYGHWCKEKKKPVEAWSKACEDDFAGPVEVDIKCYEHNPQIKYGSRARRLKEKRPLREV